VNKKKIVSSGATQTIRRVTLDIGGNETKVREKIAGDGKKREQEIQSSWRYVGMFSQIGFSIVAPIVAGVLVGKMVDGRWLTYPTGIHAGLGIGIGMSIVTFIYTVRSMIRDN
jgi:F0F1-type ATP synthase assembly protein I